MNSWKKHKCHTYPQKPIYTIYVKNGKVSPKGKNPGIPEKKERWIEYVKKMK